MIAFRFSDRTAPNEPLIREVLTFIQLHPERWDQSRFLSVGECGTIGCFAGWAAMLGHSLELDYIDEKGLHALAGKRLVSVPVMLGLTVDQFVQIYGFTSVWDYDERGLPVRSRPPTFAELCAKVEEVTGIRFKEEVEL